MSRPVDGGFTLVELLVAAGIAALIAPVLTGALVVGWRTSTDTVDRLGQTRNRQLVPSLFARDVQGATAVTTTPSSACTVTGDTMLVQLTVTQPMAVGVNAAQSVAWVRAAATKLVYRRTCAVGSTTVLSSVSAAHDVTGTSVSCRTSVAATPGTCGAATRLVDLTVSDALGTFTAPGDRRSG